MTLLQSAADQIAEGLSPSSDEIPGADRARESLREYVEQAWPTVEPATRFAKGWHIDAICEHLQAVSKGEIQNLLINVPPRHGKSILTSVMWPTWEWIESPGIKWLYASYGQSLATRDALASRRLIQSTWYQERFGESFTLTGDQNAKMRYDNSEHGYRISTSVGGMGTGEGGDRLCFPYDTLVSTSTGRLPIGELVERRLPVKVLAYDHLYECSRWRSITSYQKRRGRELALVRLSDGRIIRATWEHPFYIQGKGYTAVESLQVGDEVVDESQLQGVRSRGRSSSGAYGENPERCLLQPRVPRHMADGREQPRVSGRQSFAQLRDMQCSIQGESAQGAQGVRTLLLEGMPGDWSEAWSAQSCNTQVRDVRHSGREAALPRQCSQLLLEALCEQGSQQAYVEGRQPSLRSRHEPGALLCAIPPDGSISEGAGQAGLPEVRDDSCRARQGVRCTSHQLRQGRQLHGEPSLPVPMVSRGDAWRTGQSRRLGRVLVESVEPDEAPEYVYNLSVAEDRNYFANGVLVHNCIDDAHKADEADSESLTELLAAVEWHNKTWSTRANSKHSSRVVIMQRLHELDIVGDIQEKMQEGGRHYEQLILPAEYEPSVQIQVSSLGWKDPRTEEGQLLWPERFTRSEIESLKVQLKDAASGQLQQRPAPASGAIIQREWFEGEPTYHFEDQFEHVNEAIPQRNRYELGNYYLRNLVRYRWISYDTAFKDKDSNAPTGIVVWEGLDNGILMVRYAEEELMEVPDVEDRLREDFRKWDFDNKLVGIVVEDKGSGIGILQTLRRTSRTIRSADGRKSLANMLIPFDPKQDSKEFRARQASVWLRRDCVWLPEQSLKAPWLPTFEDRLFKFPFSKTKDMVDAFTQFILYSEPRIQKGWETRSGFYKQAAEEKRKRRLEYESRAV